MVRGVRTCLAFACWTAHSGDSVLDVDPASKIQASCRRLLAMHISNHEPLRTHTHAVRHGHKQARGTHTHTHTYTSFTRSSLHPGSDAALARYRVLPTRCKFGVILCISLACCQPPLDSAGMHSILFLKSLSLSHNVVLITSLYAPGLYRRLSIQPRNVLIAFSISNSSTLRYALIRCSQQRPDPPGLHS